MRVWETQVPPVSCACASPAAKARLSYWCLSLSWLRALAIGVLECAFSIGMLFLGVKTLRSGAARRGDEARSQGRCFNALCSAFCASSAAASWAMPVKEDERPGQEMAL